jgi:predicted PurR-regulated permease PerM
MARTISFIALVLVLAAMAALFFEVMADFLLPLFLALLLVVVFRPLNRWFCGKCGRHNRIAAGLTTGTILLIVFVPLSVLLIAAGREAQSVYRAAMNSRPPIATAAPAAPSAPSDAKPEVGNIDDPILKKANAFADWSAEKLVAFAQRMGITVEPKDLETSMASGVQKFVAPLALRTTQFLGRMLVCLAVMILATYYFFADGSTMLESLLRLSPLETSHTQALLDQFGGITRAVVTATMVSACVQGILLAAGYYVAGLSSLFLLIALSMLLTLVPFVGAALVWAPACLWLFAIEGRTPAAVILAVYCLAVGLIADNFVKPLVLHGQSNLHPLLALLSVIGGIQALGPIGILVGPMVVAFLQTLLNMVHAELMKLQRENAD